jgi:hypothetical protein
MQTLRSGESTQLLVLLTAGLAADLINWLSYKTAVNVNYQIIMECTEILTEQLKKFSGVLLTCILMPMHKDVEIK